MGEASDYFVQARKRATESGDQAGLAVALLRLSQVHREQKELEVAIEQSSHALELAETSGARILQGEAQYMLADLHRLAGRHGQALEGFTQAESTLGEIGDPELLWQVFFTVNILDVGPQLPRRFSRNVHRIRTHVRN